MNSILRFFLLFSTGGAVYSTIEVLFRGHTHWSMTIAGGVCLLLIYRMDVLTAGKPLALKCLLGSAIITAVELAVGVIVNLLLGWSVWDYSHLPMNLLGQVCMTFSALWMLLTIPALYICRFFRSVVFPRFSLV